MPASSDCIGEALHLAYRHPHPSPHPPHHHHHHSSPHAPTPPPPPKQLQDQLSVCGKQILSSEVEYEPAGRQQSILLDKLKSKYVIATATTATTTTSTTMAQGTPRHPQGTKDDQLEEPQVVLWSRDKVTLGWRKTFPPGAGMVNLGNTCYLNSSLQALFHIPALANWLLEELQSHTQRCEGTNAANTSAAFCSVCAMMRTLRATLDRATPVIKPALIQHKLKSIGKTLMYGRQEDAHEFIKLLLDHMEKSYLAFRRATKLDHRSKETTPLNQIFGGYLRQQVICPLCRYVSTTFSHFQDLVLDIRSVSSVDDALNLHFRKETLDSENAYRCEKCHKKVSATKRHLIERAPHVLLIQLKRFTMSGGKIGKHINIQRTIDLSRFVSGGKASGGGGPGQYQYRLTSMVIHLGGSQHGGHYTAVAEASNGTMFEFDDSSVRSISLQSALLRNPYILFYEMLRRPKEIPAVKQVLRQSSEKVLIRQNSDGVIGKSLPTSHSASSVANGWAGDAAGPVGASGGPGVKGHVPQSIASHKDRERLSFPIKPRTIGVESGTNKPSKLIIHSSSTLLSKTAPSTPKTSSTKPKLSSASSPKPSAKAPINPSAKSNSTPGTPKPSTSRSTIPSLVPYLDDSDDSEVDDGKRKEKKNGLKNGKDKPSVPVAQRMTNGESKEADGKRMVPRALQVVPGRAKIDSGWQVTDSALHSPSECSGGSGGSGCRPFTVVDQPANSTKTEADNQGWTVTVVERAERQRQRPELEKSLSHDGVLRTEGSGKDVDSSSLRSKTSVDSGRSDKSAKSMKRSIFSLFTCVSSARSPDSPPASTSPPTSASTSSPTLPLHKDVTNGLPHPSVSEQSDGTQSKRGRETEEEPSSPSKKPCQDGQSATRLAEKEQASSSSDSPRGADSGNGKLGSESEERFLSDLSGSLTSSTPSISTATASTTAATATSTSSAPSAATTTSTTSKNAAPAKNSFRPPKNLKVEQNGTTNGTTNGATNGTTNGATKDSSSTSTSTSSLSSSSETEAEEEEAEGRWAEKWRKSNGSAKVHPSPSIINWDDANRKKVELWGGSRSSSVVDELRRAGNSAYGAEVKSWSGSRSEADQEAERMRREAKKRSAADLYNEEMDSGRNKKMKGNKKGGWGGGSPAPGPSNHHHHNHNQQQQQWNNNNNNPFQRLQDTRFNNNNNSNRSPANHHHHNHHNRYNNNYNSHRYHNPYHHHHNHHNNNNSYWDKGGRSWGRNNNNNNRRQKPHNKKYREKYKHSW